MTTLINNKQLKMYVLPAFAIGLLLAVVQPLFVFVGTIQFFVGSIQLLIALFKTIYCFIKLSYVPTVIKYYWILVLTYFVLMVFGGIALNILFTSNNIIAPIALFYLGLAWGIAIYHFKHVMFL